MPSLYDIAGHFDDIDISDGYTQRHLFKAQLSSFNESSKDGTTNKKRIMSVRPGTVMPTRRLIGYFGERWMVGDGNTDGLQNTAVRTTYWITKVIDLVKVLTPAQACLASTGVAMASSKVYLKDTVNSTTDSDYDAQWDFTLCKNETVVKGQYLGIGTKLYRVRSTHETAGGFLVANSDELDGTPRVPVILSSAGVFDPVTETRSGVTTNTFGILVDTSKLYRFRSEADPRYLSGDMTLIMAQFAPVGSLVTLAGVQWKAMTVTPELDGWNLHIRRA